MTTPTPEQLQAVAKWLGDNWIVAHGRIQDVVLLHTHPSDLTCTIHARLCELWPATAVYYCRWKEQPYEVTVRDRSMQVVEGGATGPTLHAALFAAAVAASKEGM